MTLFSKALIVVVVACFLSTAYIIRQAHTGPVVTKYYNVKVLSESGAYGYWMAFENSPDPPFYALFCSDETEPPFGTGQVLNYLAVDNFGDCWSIKSDRAHYLMRRNPDGTLYKFR